MIVLGNKLKERKFHNATISYSDGYNLSDKETIDFYADGGEASEFLNGLHDNRVEMAYNYGSESKENPFANLSGYDTNKTEILNSYLQGLQDASDSGDNKAQELLDKYGKTAIGYASTLKNIWSIIKGDTSTNTNEPKVGVSTGNQKDTKDNTWLYIGIIGGIVVVSVAIIALRR